MSVAVHANGRELRWGTALLIEGAALGGLYVGSPRTALVPGAVLLLSFGVLLALVGFGMWRSPNTNNHVPSTPQRPSLMLTAGSFVGLLTDFLRVGGGFLVVSALSRLAALASTRPSGRRSSSSR